MDLKYLKSDEKIGKIINDILTNEPKITYNCVLTPLGMRLSELYLKAVILYVRSEKATEDSLYEEIYKMAMLPVEMQETVFSEKKEKDYHIAFEKFLSSCKKEFRQNVADVVSDKVCRKLEEGIFSM